MIQFSRPENLNGGELLDELASIGIILDKETQLPFLDANGNFWLDVKLEDESAAAAVVSAHNGTTVAPEPTIADKLAAAGLTVEELKEALGL